MQQADVMVNAQWCKKMKYGLLYKLTFPNGKLYIGITRESLAMRIRRHIQYARQGRMLALSCAIRAHGESSFIAEVIGQGDWDSLKQMEIAAILEHRQAGFVLYNMTNGGDGSLGLPRTAETKAKISAALKGRVMYFSDEHKKRISEAQKGKVIPEDVKQKMREAAKRRCSLAPMSPEQRKKISDSLLGKKHSADRVAARVATRKQNGSY